jgi:transcriptional regulator with XRE-family HTH domain
MTAHEDLARYLYTCRKTAKLTQEVVGEALEIDPSQVSRWEKGKQLPRQSRAAALAKLYDVDLAEMREKIGAAYEEEVEDLASEREVTDGALSAVEQLTERLESLQPMFEELLRRLPPR